jgi:Icc-related predicted phosphoesterase
MGLFKKREGGGDADTMKVLFATDIHGSEPAFRKFVNAAVKFEVDVLLLGGDLTGKALVPVVKENGGHRAEFMGRELRSETSDELEALEKTIRMSGQYPFRTTPDELEFITSRPEEIDQRFLDAMRESLRSWFDLAAERLAGRSTRMAAIAGNDDPPEIDEVLAGHEFVEHVDQRVVEIGDLEIVGFSGANRTPWKSPREYDEDEIRSMLEQEIARLRDPEQSIWNIHVPPYGSGLDTCYEIRDDLTVVTDGGEPRLIGAGSTAVRDLIESYQPKLSVHGHIHESRGVSRLGSTVAVNPGSEYTEGVLRAAYIRVGSRGVKAQLLST